MLNYVDVFVADWGIILGDEIALERRDFVMDAWVKTVDIERGKRMLLHVGYSGEPISHFWCAFPLVEFRRFSDFRVDLSRICLLTFSEFAFCGIYEAVVNEVVFVVF